MTVLAFLLIVAATVFMVRLIRKTVQEAVARMEAQVLERQRVLDKQAKVHVRNQAVVLRASTKLADETRKVHDQGRAMHVQVQQILCDPKIQAALARAEEVSVNG